MVPLRVFNVSNEVCNLASETVVALAKPVVDVTSLKLYEENDERIVDQARVISQHESQGTFEKTLPEPLQELLGRRSEYLTDSETERLQELLFNYQHVFSLSDRDLGTTHMVQHIIETGNAPPPPPPHDAFLRQVTDLLQQEKVKESSSPW